MDVSLKQQAGRFWCIDFGVENVGEAQLKRLLSIFKRVTPHVFTGSQRVFLDVSASQWKRSFTSFQLKLGELAKKQGLNPDSWQWGVAKTLSEAWVRARYQTSALDLLPIEAVSDFLSPFEHRKRTPAETRKFRVLRSLGLSTLQDLTEVPEDVLLTQCGVWIAEFTREHFCKREKMRDNYLERATAESLLKADRPFQLEDWIPEEYLAVG